MITVEKIDEATFKVTVDSQGTVTQHRVTVSPDYLDRLTKGNVSPEILVEQSFKFLLQRESNTSILSSFDLPIIGSYFPEYESIIRKMVSIN